MPAYLSHLDGQRLAAAVLDADTQAWGFTFSDRCALRVGAPWRLVSEGHIVVGSEDDGHRFGLESPVDARERVTRAVGGEEVTEVSIKKFGDLDLSFASGATLQVFNGSSGYEGWQLFGPGER